MCEPLGEYRRKNFEKCDFVSRVTGVGSSARTTGSKQNDNSNTAVQDRDIDLPQLADRRADDFGAFDEQFQFVEAHLLQHREVQIHRMNRARRGIAAVGRA